MNINYSTRLTDIIRFVSGAGTVFEALGIDYSCAGDRTLQEVARAEGVDPHVVLSALRRLPLTPDTDQWSDRSLSELAHHLVAEHHKLLREELAAIGRDLEQICGRVSMDAGMQEVKMGFERLADFVVPHIYDEEQGVLGEIEQLESRWESGATGGDREAELRRHIAEVLVAHGAISEQLREVRGLRLAAEDDAELDASSRDVLVRLAWLEAHLHEYMFLENCVLLPRAIAMEEEMAMT